MLELWNTIEGLIVDASDVIILEVEIKEAGADNGFGAQTCNSVPTQIKRSQ